MLLSFYALNHITYYNGYEGFCQGVEWDFSIKISFFRNIRVKNCHNADWMGHGIRKKRHISEETLHSAKNCDILINANNEQKTKGR